MKIALITIVTNYTLHYEMDKLAEKKKSHHVFSYPVNGLYVQFRKRNKRQ